MTRSELKVLIRDLYLYFRMKEPALSDQIDEWAKDLEYIDTKSVEHIKNQIKDCDSLPRNLPKTIKFHFSEWKRKNKPNSGKKYDPYDDPIFPVGYLYHALDVLEKRGEDEFMAYCRSVSMPLQDIERVRNKANCIFNIEDLKQIDEIGEVPF